MGIKSTMNGDVAVIALEGDIGMKGNADSLPNVIDELLAEGKRNILVDLQGVNWVNSEGFGILLSSNIRVTNANGQFKLMRAGERFNNLYLVMHLHRAFPIYPTEDEALASYETGAKPTRYDQGSAEPSS
ncbi:MAG: STAS domain-containing protein [Nanoarchaeota archaeon]